MHHKKEHPMFDCKTWHCLPLCILLSVAALPSAQAQDGLAQSPETSTVDRSAVTGAAPAELGVGTNENMETAAPDGVTSDAEATTTAGLDGSDAPLSVASPTDPVVTPARPTAPKPIPSPFKDPKGTLDWLLTQTHAESQNLSPIGMYRSADIVVKLVMLGLVFASFVTWTVWVAKTLEFWGARWRVRRARAVLAKAATLVEAGRCPEARRGVVGRMMAEARSELTQSEPALDHAGHSGLKERLTAALARLEAEAGRRMARGTGVLATIGSTAPFVGLFGTVWGIMNSFISIAESNTTNLAVVAPGIAEALLATAMGLVAAIPAVVIYNLFARSIAGYRLLLGDAGERIERLVSRDLDHRAIPPENAQEISQEAA
jgi:biopolymer transport protein ExbB